MTKRTATERKRLWLPSTLAIGTAALIWAAVGGVASCDSTAKFSLPDRKFTDVQVVTAFPVVVQGGIATRVCGAPLDGEIPLTPNGVELTVNFVGSELKGPLCPGDADLSIKEGELIELLPVKTVDQGATVGPANFPITIDCVEPYSPMQQCTAGSACSTPISNQNVTPDLVRYDNVVNRCDEKSESTRLNVAMLVDHSGSISGFVDKTTLLEDQKGDIDQPDKLEPSDQSHARIRATERLLDSLNPRDRIIGYYFDEKVGAAVAASDQLACTGGSRDGMRCLFDKDCPGNGSIGCFRGAGDPANPVIDTFKEKVLTEAEADAFGANQVSRVYMKAALDFKVKYDGDGRAPLWHGIKTAYDFLKKNAPSGGRHIVIITDGPDTCTNSEDFAYKNGASKCRVTCASAKADFEAVRQLMHADKYPVRVHFIQFQAQAQEYRSPDPRMVEVACRTGGTYQFINSQEMNVSSSEFSNALTRAALRVRYAMSGNWRVTFSLPWFGSNSEIKPGTLYSVRGHLQFKNKRFPSLDPIYATQAAWRFGCESGNEDRRLLMRTSCAAHSECKGTDDCAANHCSQAGLCVSGAAPDRLPCKDNVGVCCKGACLTNGDCKEGCK